MLSLCNIHNIRRCWIHDKRRSIQSFINAAFAKHMKIHVCTWRNSIFFIVLLMNVSIKICRTHTMYCRCRTINSAPCSLHCYALYAGCLFTHAIRKWRVTSLQLWIQKNNHMCTYVEFNFNSLKHANTYRIQYVLASFYYSHHWIPFRVLG